MSGSETFSTPCDIQPRLEIITPVRKAFPIPLHKRKIKAGTPTILHHAFEAYLEAFRYGMPPHGGFAIGLERLLMQLLGAPNLRLTTLFPQDLTRLTP